MTLGNAEVLQALRSLERLLEAQDAKIEFLGQQVLELREEVGSLLDELEGEGDGDDEDDDEDDPGQGESILEAVARAALEKAGKETARRARRR